jgi:hypothetical protein
MIDMAAEIEKKRDKDARPLILSAVPIKNPPEYINESGKKRGKLQ